MICPQGNFRPQPALGQQIQKAHLSLCSLVPTQYIPGVRQAVEQIGCHPASRGALTQAILREYGGSQASWYQQMAAAVGPELLAECICSDSKYNVTVQDRPVERGVGWMTILAIGAAAVGAALWYKRSRVTPVPPTPPKE